MCVFATNFTVSYVWSWMMIIVEKLFNVCFLFFVFIDSTDYFLERTQIDLWCLFLPFVTAPLYFVHVLSIRESVYMQSFIEKLQRNSFSIFLFQWYMYRVKLILHHVIDIFTCMKCSIYYHVFDAESCYTYKGKFKIKNVTKRIVLLSDAIK